MTAPRTYTPAIIAVRTLIAVLAGLLIGIAISFALRDEWATVGVLALILVLVGSAWATGEFDSRDRGDAR